MSELTPCNFCTLRGIRRHLPPGKKVVLRPEALGGLKDGVACYVVDADVPDEDVSGPGWVSWFMELSDECCC